LAATDPSLEAIYRCSIAVEIPQWMLTEHLRRAERAAETEKARQDIRQRFASDLDLVRSGEHIGWIAWAANIYFGSTSDLDISLSPDQRLDQALGTDLAAAARQGFIALINRPDLPTLSAVASLSAQRMRDRRWHALLAGMDEAFRRSPELDQFSATLLRIVLAIQLVDPAFKRDGRKYAPP
jgi:hypothetical protein